MKIEVDGVEYSPAVDISELPTHTMQFPAGLRRASPEQSPPYVMLSDLRKVAVRDTSREKELQDRVADLNDHLKGHIHTIQELEAKVRELESKLESLASDKKYLQDVRNDLQAELSTLREQGKWELGEPLTLEEWSQLIDEPVIYNTSAGLRQDVARGKPFMENCVYLDPRPLPTLPEPEMPKFKGVVRRRSRRREFIFVNEIGISAVYGITPSGIKDGANVYDVELYDHPEVPNTPELAAALNTGEKHGHS